MKYYKWKLNWSNPQYGTDPSAINSETIRVEPSFENGNLIAPETFVYGMAVLGEVDLAKYSDWQMVEVTAEDFLAQAQLTDSSSSLDSDGKLLVTQRTF